jgi:RNA polymerase sigma-70 factor (ECF subfamily)
MEECVQRFAPLVWGAARRYLGTNPDAEDTVQEIFIELWRCADRFDPALGTETAFVMTLARRRLLDTRRRLQRRPEVVPIDSFDEAALPAADLEKELPDALVDDETRALAALRGLPEDQRRLLHLSIHEGWTHQEIAGNLSLPLGTVKTQLRRGLLRIRQALARTVALLL